MATKEQIYKVLVDSNPNFGQVDMDTALKAASNMNPAWGEAIASAESSAPAMALPPKGEPQLGTATAIRGLAPTEKAAEWAPAVGGTVGGIGGFLMGGPAGAAVGTAGGAAVGKYIEQKYHGSPDLMERASEIGKEASLQALAGEAIPMGLKGAAVATKNVSSMLSRGMAGLMSAARGTKPSYESISRFLMSKGPSEAIATGKDTLSAMRETNEMARLSSAVEKNATEEFQKLQNAIETHRSTLGKAVERADKSLSTRMKGITIDMSKRADDYGNQLNAVMSDARSAEYVKTPEYNKMQTFVENLKNAPYADIDSLIAFRRTLDEQINWRKMPLAEPIPDAVERVMKYMRDDISNRIKAEAKKKGLSVYPKIYDKFSAFAENWSNTLRKAYGAANESDMANADAFTKFVNLFNKSGYRAEVLKGTADMLPPAYRVLVDKLMDHAAAHNILTEIGAPSSPLAGVIRELMVNPTTLNMLKAGKNLSGKSAKAMESKIAEAVGRSAGAYSASSKEK